MMEIIIGSALLRLKTGDITEEDTDIIVNAANKSLMGGGGVDGAIHRKGGPAILKECLKIGKCETGQAVLTTGGNLKAGNVIHTVGPVWKNGTDNEETLLKECYYNSLILVSKLGKQSVSFPSISTGAYGYPVNKASRIALETIIKFLKENDKSGIKTINMVLFDQITFDSYKNSLEDLISENNLSLN